MSIFNELLLKINEIPNGFTESIKDDLKSALQSLAEFETDFISEKNKLRELTKKLKISTAILQSINEDEDESNKTPETNEKQAKSSISSALPMQSTKSAPVLEEQNGKAKPRRSKKRSKDEVEDMSSPEQEKRPKRNASVRAQSVISKQRKSKDKPWWKILDENGAVLMSDSKLVNVNLTQKMRREENSTRGRSSAARRRGGAEDKENDVPIVKVKQEKISLPSSEVPDNLTLTLTSVEVKKESAEVMPPPAPPGPKTRGRPAKNKDKDKSEEKDKDKEEEAEEGGRRRNTRKKQTDTMPPPPVPSSRSTRASARDASHSLAQEEPPTDARPTRTRTKKKASEVQQSEPEKETTVVNGSASPAEKPRPKRTRRGKAAEKQKSQESPVKEPEIISPKEERISEPIQREPSLILQKENINVTNVAKEPKATEVGEETPPREMEKTQILDANTTVTVPEQNNLNNLNNMNSMNMTVVLTNGVYEHEHSTPKNIHMNETVVLESKNRGTVVIEKPANQIMDSTVVIEKASSNVTEDDSLMTNDESVVTTPPRPATAQAQSLQPGSAVKEKVQQFEELATRVTRTKTRAMAKKEPPSPPARTPPPVLSADTLAKMNHLIFNNKPNAQISSSASKPRVNVPTNIKNVTNSTSKMAAINKMREREDELAREKEDARSKKEALLEARRELQRKKREEKMAAAAAARLQAEKERRIALEAAQRGREEKQQTADLGRAERLKEAERKKQELARKVAETEERRRAEERARQARLAEEQRRAEAARRHQQAEAEAMKKEAALMEREIEKRQKEYNEKKKLKQRMEAEKIATPVRNLYAPMEPVYMKDGFEFLNSDEEEDSKPSRPPPLWSSSKVRWATLTVQAHVSSRHIDRLFSVRVHSPDLREIFPDIDRRALKRTSSAVWRTPERLPVLQE